MYNNYQELRYNHYNAFYLEQYGGNEMTQLLPPKYEGMELNKSNSMLVNPVNCNTIGGEGFPEFNKDKIFKDLRNIDSAYSDCIFQLVLFEDVIYINQHFKQPNELLIRKVITVGRLSSNEKSIISTIRKMQLSLTLVNDNIPNYNSICVTRKNSNKTKLMYKCVEMGLPIYTIQDYKNLVKDSPFWMYIKG